MQPSSADLHPKSGARFVFTLRGEGEGEAPCYDLEIYLPAGRDWRGELRWQDGRSVIVDEPTGPEQGDEELRRALVEAHKLARVLHRDPKPKLSRWRALD